MTIPGVGGDWSWWGSSDLRSAAASSPLGRTAAGLSPGRSAAQPRTLTRSNIWSAMEPSYLDMETLPLPPSHHTAFLPLWLCPSYLTLYTQTTEYQIKPVTTQCYFNLSFNIHVLGLPSRKRIIAQNWHTTTDRNSWNINLVFLLFCVDAIIFYNDHH